VLAVGQFSTLGPSHLDVLVITVLGGAALIVLGRRADPSVTGWVSRVLAVAVLAVNAFSEIRLLDPAHLAHTVPLELSDIAPYFASWALWSRSQWAFGLTYFWCLTLSSQALITPALAGPDFPSVNFLVFFANHVLVVWAAIFLTWGLRMRPRWRDYGITVAATFCWAVPTGIFNALAGTDYGYLNAKPPAASLLDALSPWPLYLVEEVAVVLVVWALMTVAWTRNRRTTPATNAVAEHG